MNLRSNDHQSQRCFLLALTLLWFCPNFLYCGAASIFPPPAFLPEVCLSQRNSFPALPWSLSNLHTGEEKQQQLMLELFWPTIILQCAHQVVCDRVPIIQNALWITKELQRISATKIIRVDLELLDSTWLALTAISLYSFNQRPRSHGFFQSLIMMPRNETL